MSSRNKTEYLKLSQFENDDIPQWRTDYTGDMAIIDKAVKELTDISEELKKSVSDGKKLVATAITEKGVATLPTDSFTTMAENIGQIESGSSFDRVIVSLDRFMINTSALGCSVYLG